jgi:hypothetical protein
MTTLAILLLIALITILVTFAGCVAISTYYQSAYRFRRVNRNLGRVRR